MSTSQVSLEAKINRHASSTAEKMLMSATAAAAISGVRNLNWFSLLGERRIAFLEAPPMRASSMNTRSTSFLSIAANSWNWPSASIPRPRGRLAGAGIGSDWREGVASSSRRAIESRPGVPPCNKQGGGW